MLYYSCQTCIKVVPNEYDVTICALGPYHLMFRVSTSFQPRYLSHNPISAGQHVVPEENEGYDPRFQGNDGGQGKRIKG